MIQHTTWRIVVKDYVFFLFFRLCWVYCFYEAGICNYMFFCLVLKTLWNL
ncbi:hypothetical protein HanHA300_Chr15g0550231 [Helianthus annuus]|nr:hypothetical protein HanHA300_Chr15g0550231 [Helianthus annuus]